VGHHHRPALAAHVGHRHRPVLAAQLSNTVTGGNSLHAKAFRLKGEGFKPGEWKNKIYGLELDGININSKYTCTRTPPPLDSGRIELAAHNDRIYTNGRHGICVDDPGIYDPCSEVFINLFHETICHNDGDGVIFLIDDPGADRYIKGYNSIFCYNAEDVDSSSWPGLPSGFWNCFWQYGLDGGGINHQFGNAGCNGDPNFHPIFNPTGPYHLKQASPCVDFGDHNNSNGLRLDMEGDGRTLNGNPQTPIETDMGADELKIDE